MVLASIDATDLTHIYIENTQFTLKFYDISIAYKKLKRYSSSFSHLLGYKMECEGHRQSDFYLMGSSEFH